MDKSFKIKVPNGTNIKRLKRLQKPAKKLVGFEDTNGNLFLFKGNNEKL